MWVCDGMTTKWAAFHSIHIRGERDKRGISEESASLHPVHHLNGPKTRQRWELSSPASEQHHQNNDMREIHPFGRDDARTNTNMYTQFIRSFDFFLHFFIMIFYDVCMFYLFAEHNFCFGVGGGGRGAAAAKAKCVCVYIETPNSLSVDIVLASCSCWLCAAQKRGHFLWFHSDFKSNFDMRSEYWFERSIAVQAFTPATHRRPTHTHENKCVAYIYWLPGCKMLGVRH